MITKAEAKSGWRDIVGAVKSTFGQITGDDLTKVEGDVEQLIALLQRKTGQSKERLESFVSEAVNNASGTVNRISDAATQYAGQAAEKIRENYDSMAESAQYGYDQTMRQVSRRPMESVAIALGAGLLTGLIVGLSLGNRR